MPEKIPKTTAYKKWKRDQFLKKDFPFYIELIRNNAADVHSGIRFQREFWKISYIPEGNGEYIVNDRTYKYSPGTIILTHPDAKTTFQFDQEQMDCYNILFDAALIDDDLGRLQDDFGFCSIFRQELSPPERDSVYVLKCDPEMKALILSLHREFKQKDANYRINIRYTLMKLLILLMRQSAEHGRSMTADEVVDYVDNFLQQTFREEFNLPRLARRIGLSACYLCKLYRRQTGTTIVARLKQLRLETAEYELRHTAMPISDICFRSGFNDLSYFYRSFRARFGRCPADVRRDAE